MPYLRTWIEQRRRSSRLRVYRLRLCSFVIITGRAGQPQIILFGTPPSRQWNDVLNVQRDSYHCLLRLTVAAPITCSFRHTLPNNIRDVGSIHYDLAGTFNVAGSVTSYPRCFSNNAACARINISRSYSASR